MQVTCGCGRDGTASATSWLVTRRLRKFEEALNAQLKDGPGDLSDLSCDLSQDRKPSAPRMDRLLRSRHGPLWLADSLRFPAGAFAAPGVVARRSEF